MYVRAELMLFNYIRTIDQIRFDSPQADRLVTLSGAEVQ